LLESHIARVAAAANAIVLTRDSDFATIAEAARQPHVIWLRAGNMTNARLRSYLEAMLPGALDAIEQGALVVEI
jgi:predicted nuclease of predicted toxin-antitoxin system